MFFMQFNRTEVLYAVVSSELGMVLKAYCFSYSILLLMLLFILLLHDLIYEKNLKELLLHLCMSHMSFIRNVTI